MAEPKFLTDSRKCKRCSNPVPSRNGIYCSQRCYLPPNRPTCETCAHEFKAVGSGVRFCSRVCYEAHRQKQMEHICKQCGELFKAPNSVTKNPPMFCSTRCRGASQKNTVHLICATCQIPIARQRGIAKAKTAYCSTTCHGIGKADRFNIKCIVCQIEFSVTRFFVEKRKARYCSQLCKRRFSGETGIEQAVRLALDALSIQYQQEYPVQHNPAMKRRGHFYFLDFFLPDARIAIEVDGLYWHKSRRKADAKRDAFLATKGIEVIRITDKEIESAESVTALLFTRLLHR